MRGDSLSGAPAAMFWGIAYCRCIGLMMRLLETWCQCKTLESSEAVRWKRCQRAAIEVREAYLFERT